MPTAEETSTGGKLSAQASQDGQGGTEAKAEHRYIYYRLYAKDGSLESHYPIYSNDRFISRISSKSVRPPHTAVALKRCLCRVEGFEGAENSSLFLTLSENAPLDDTDRVSLRGNSGAGSSELNPVVLVVGLVTAEKRAKPKKKADPKELLVWQAEQRHIYYRLYDEDIEGISKTSFDEDDPSLGRINTFSIPPPHTVASLKCCLVKAEAIPGHDVQLLENEDGEITMNDSDTIALLADEIPGLTEDQPIVLTYTRKLENQTTAPHTSFSERLTITQSWAGSTMDPTWHSITTGEIFQTDGIRRTEPFTHNTSRSEFPCYVGINSFGKKAFVHAAYCAMPPPHYDFSMKLLLIGDSGVGKSGLLHRFCNNAWTPSFLATIGIDFMIRTIELDGKRIKLQIWDIAGAERFRTLATAYYRGAMGILLVYDVTYKQSFDNIRRWHSSVKEHASEGVNKILIGNKSEWMDKRAVTVEEGRELAKELGVMFLETSAKINQGVDEAFFTLARDIKTRLID